MSINLRIYADQIYGFTQSYLNEYITPEIIKEDFINNFKSGKLNYELISTKKTIKLNPQINLDELIFENLEINIPDETGNLSIIFGKLKGALSLNEVMDNEIEKIILEERKTLIEGFIKFVIKKIEKKDETKTFIESLIETFVNRAINGLQLDMNNIELNIKYKKYIVCLNIEKIFYSEEKGIQINNISICLLENEIKKDFLKKFSINIELKQKNEDVNINKQEEQKNEEKNIENNNNNEVINETDNRNKLNISITNIEFEINPNIIYAINDIYELFNTNEYKKIFLRYQNLIQYHKPKLSEDNKINYMSLWYYAIKTVIKLQKYIGHKKHNIFDLIPSSQMKIAKNYIDNNNENNLLLPNEISLLKATKEKVEKQLLENKKGSGISKAFSFFFGGGGDDDNKELTEEEKNELDIMYGDDFIMKYLLGLNEGQKSGSNPLSEKINKIKNDLVLLFHIDKIEVKENSYNCNFFIKNININCNVVNSNFDFEMNINDIGTLLNESLFSDKFEDTNYLIQIKKSQNSDKFFLNFGFNNIVLNEEMFIFIITYFYTLKFNTKIKLFKKTDYYKFIQKEVKVEENKINNNIENNNQNEESIEILENFNISHIPSLTLLNSENNKVELNIQNFIFNGSLLSFTINIQDSFCTILDNYSFNFNKEKNENKNKYKLYLDEALNIKLSKESSFFIFATYLKLKQISKNVKYKQNDDINDMDNEIKEDINKLFCFNYVEHRDINIDFNNYCLDIIINDLNFELNEENCSSFFSLKKLDLKYENKNLGIKIEKIETNIDYLSDIILYLLDFKSKDFYKYEKIISQSIKDNNEDNNNIIVNNNDNNNNVTTNYNIKVNDILSNMNLEIGIISIGIKIEQNILYANIYGIKGNDNSNEKNIISIIINNIILYAQKNDNYNEKFTVLDLHKLTNIDYNLNTELIKVKVDSPILNIFTNIFTSIYNDLEYLLLQIDWTVIICKMQAEILNLSCKISRFNIIMAYIYLSNFDGKTTDTFFLILKEFLIKNGKNINILEEKELSMNFTTKSKKEDYLEIKSKDLMTNLSQQDIIYFASLLDKNSKDKNKENINNLNENNNISFNNIKIEENEHVLVVDSKINKINIGFCLNDYTKKTDFILENINLHLKNGKIKDEENIFKDIFDYEVIMNKLKLKYYDEYKKEIMILDYSKESKKIVYNENLPQIKLISKNNNISINVNKNDINLRLDFFLFLYYFLIKSMPLKIPDKKSSNNKSINDIFKYNNDLNININLNKTRFIIPTSFNTSENLYINLDSLVASYHLKSDNKNENLIDTSSKKANPINLEIKLNKISASFISKNNSKLFNTNNTFFIFICSINHKEISINSNLGALIINLSYQDIISFIQCYSLNNILLNKIKSLYEPKPQQLLISSEPDMITSIINSNEFPSIKFRLNFGSINFTLINNSSGSYQPFINGAINKILLNYNEVNNIQLNYEFFLSSYNNISSKWEPLIENIIMNIKYNFAFAKIKKENNINIDINEINMNLSDMNISTTLVIFQNWSDKFNKDKNFFNKKVLQNDDNLSEMTKISNTCVSNYTGMNLKIKYCKKEYECQPDSNIDLEYVNNWNTALLGEKQILVMFNNNSFKIYFEKIGICQYQLNNNYFLIVENIPVKNRHTNISLYSSIIIKNKTLDNIQVKLINDKLGNYFNLLKSNDKIGIPYNYYNEDTSFSLNLIYNNSTEISQVGNNIKFYLKDILLNDNFSQNIFLGGKVFFIKLRKKYNNLKEILITFQYCIVNCLPCELILENPKEKKVITIKKFTQHFIDFYSDINTELIFKIKIGKEYFSSVKTKYFKANIEQDNGNNYYTIFSNNDKTKSFKLSIQFNKNENTNLLIIYSESLLYNDSGIKFDIISQIESNPLCFNLGNNLYLLTSKIDNIKNAWIQLRNDKFITNRIILDDIMQANPCYLLKLIKNDYILNLFIKKELSYIAIRNNPNFKEKIMTMIFKIYPACRIMNLLTSKDILIAEENNKDNCIRINTLKQVSFNFFEKGKNVNLLLGLLNNKNNNCSALLKLKLNTIGIYSFCIDDFLFNIEVKESLISGIRDIFIIESNMENAKIVIENMTNSNFIITQEGYNQFRQIILKNEKQILKIYDQNCNYFMIKDSETNKAYRFKFNSLREEKHKNEINDFIFIKESNGMKMKLTILNKDNFNQINSTYINFGLKLKIEKMLISIIGDNEYKDKKLRNYERHELLLIQLTKFIMDYNLEHYSGLLDNDKINLKLFLDKLEGYNQVSKYGKYSNVIKNISNPIFYMQSEIIDYKNTNISKIDSLKINMGKIKLNIDPNFIEEIINFGENILYQMEIINFNVDEILLPKNKDIKIKKQLENYKKGESIYYGTNFTLPELDINFELNDKDLNKLLKKKSNATPMLIWLIYGLVGKEQSLFLNSMKLNSYIGSLKGLIEKIILMYKDSASNETNKIGFQGFLGQISNYFIGNSSNKNSTEVQKGRIRYPRAFYGKYKYYKNYDYNDAKYFDILEKRFDLEKSGLYLTNIIKGNKNLFVFTNYKFLVFEEINLNILINLEYIFIDRTAVDKNNLIIHLNKKGKEKYNGELLSLDCENNINAQNISILIDEQNKSIS